MSVKTGQVQTEDGKITGGPTPVIDESLLAGLTDPLVIHDHLDRITAAIERDDPAQVIGSAKELIESVAKLVLRELGLLVDDRDDLPALVRHAQEALAIHPASVRAGPDGAEGIKKILGGAITITTGMAELRNRGYGTGHGRRRPAPAASAARSAHDQRCPAVVRVRARHARDDEAPWKKLRTGE